MTDLDALLPRLARLLDRLEAPAALAAPDWETVRAARWSAQAGGFKPILHPQRIAMKDLPAIDEQKRPVDANTQQFVAGHWVEGFERAALQWAMGRGARNGRVAWQFARDWAGRK